MPVCGLKPDGEFAVGAGFLIEEGGRRFFVTCGHLGHCANPPSSDWSLWTDRLRVFLRKDAYFEIGLFQNTGSARVPTFHHLMVEGDKHIADAIAFDLAGPAISDPALFHGYSVCAPETFKLEVGQTVFGYGFPGLRDDRWPYAPPDLVEGTFVGVVGAAVHCALPVRSGHSGGPLFTADGNLIGMIMGDNDGEAVIIPRPVLKGIAHYGRRGGKLD